MVAAGDDPTPPVEKQVYSPSSSMAMFVMVIVDVSPFTDTAKLSCLGLVVTRPVLVKICSPVVASFQLMMGDVTPSTP